MAKVLFILRKMEGGGAERQLISLARGLMELAHEVTIAVWVAGGPYERDIERSGIQHVVFEKHGSTDVAGFLWRIAAAVRRIQPDVIHGYLDTGNFVAAVLRPIFPRSRIAWGIRNSGLELEQYDLGGRLLFHLSRPLSKFVDVIIANSHAGAAHAQTIGYPSDRTHVVPNGIDVDFFRRAPERGAALRTRWGFAEGDTVIGLAARLDPMKDHANFVAAARILAARRPHVRFVCVGEGIEPYRSAALATLRESGLGHQLLWEGFNSDMPAFYSAVDLATSASRFGEGFSNSIAEAMACGVPCVVTDVGDSRLIVGDDGRVVPTGDPAALAAGWESLLDNMTPSLGAACRARISDNFNVTRLVAATEALILPERLRRSPITR